MVGILKELIDSIDNIKLSDGAVQVKTLAVRVDAAATEAKRLLGFLRDEQDVEVVARNLGALVSDLPTNPKSPKNKRASSQDIQNYRSSVKDFQLALHEQLHRTQQGN